MGAFESALRDEVEKRVSNSLKEQGAHSHGLTDIVNMELKDIAEKIADTHFRK